MLIWMCALACEAKPLIDYYRLQKNSDQSLPHRLYQREDIYCIVSGIGLQNMQQAMQFAQDEIKPSAQAHWINLGIAGHRDLALGTLLQITECTSANQPLPIKLTKRNFSGIDSAPIISVSNQTIDYPQQHLVDMEAWTFAQHCQTHNISDRCHCLKVISDNANHTPNRDKARISRLIDKNISDISDFAAHLEDDNNA